MNAIEKRQYEMFVRVRDFGLAQGDRFPESTLGGDAFAAVDAAVDALNRHAATQFSSRREARSGASTDAAEYRALVATLDAISRTARAVALDTAGVEGRFRVPKGQGKLAIVSNLLGDDGSAMASWAIARRIEHYRGTRSAGAASSAAGTTGTAATAAVAPVTAATPQPTNV